jgi:predicted phage tail protein
MATKKKADTVEAVEADQPEGVITTEQAAGAYVVQWHVKAGGKRHAPGDTVDLDDNTAAPLLASGAIVKG